MAEDKIKKFSLKGLFLCIFSFIKEKPFVTSLIIFLFLISSLTEAVGISALLIVLLEFFNLDTSQNQIIIKINDFFNFFGIELTLNSMLFVFFITIIFKSIIQFSSLYISSLAGLNIAQFVRKNLVEKLISAKYSFLINIPIGKIITHLNDEADKISIFYVKFCRTINYLIQTIVYSGLAILASWKMSFLLVFFGLISSLLLNRFNKIFYIIGQEFLSIKRIFNNNVSNLFTSIKPLKAMGLERFGSSSIENDIKEIKKNMKKYWLFESILLAFQEPFSFIFIVIFIISSIEYFGIPAVTALFVAIIFYRLSNRLLNFYNSVRSLGNFLASVNSIKEIESTADKEREYYSKRYNIRNVNKIKFENITFKYKKNIIFENVSTTFDLKKILYIEGDSGAGKTTLVDLIIGLNKPDKGIIKLNNQSINNINLLDWRKQIGYASQDPALFDDTILNNLTLMKDYNMKEIEKILEITFCKDFINKFDKKINTVIGNRGTKISGGQRQRLSIARALIQKPDLLILDEATSELNPDLEKKILAGIIKYKEATGIIIISHNNKNKKLAEKYYKIRNKKITKYS